MRAAEINKAKQAHKSSHALARLSPKPLGFAQVRKILSGQRALIAALIGLVTVLVFLPSLKDQFLDWDDSINFLGNDGFRGIGWHNLKWAMGAKTLGVYQPLAWMLLGLEYAFFGLSSRGYHAVSIALHGLNVMMVFLLIDALLRQATIGLAISRRSVTFGSAVAAILFGIHPLRTEAVAWISCQPYLLCASFLLMSAYAYLRHCDGRGNPKGWWWACFLLYALALVSKAAAVTFPLFLVLLDFFPFRTISGGPKEWLDARFRRVWAEKIPFLAIGLVFVILAIWARDIQPIPEGEHFHFAARFLHSGYAIAFFLLKTVFPVGLTGFYAVPREAVTLQSPIFMGYTVLVVAFFGLLFAFRKRFFTVWLVWLSYVGVLAPNLGWIDFSTVLTGDRYSYIGTLGWFVLLASGLSRLIDSARNPRFRAIFAGGFALVGSALIVLTWQQQKIWANSEVFWTHALKHGGEENFFVNQNLAMAMAANGKNDEAIGFLKKALEVSFTTHQRIAVFNHMAILQAEEGRLEESLDWIRKAMAVPAEDYVGRSGDDAITRNNFGVILDKMDFIDEATKEFREARRLNPDYEDATVNLRSIEKRRKSLDADILRARGEVKSHPKDIKMRNRLGVLLGMNGKLDEAIAEFQELVRLSSKFAPAKSNIDHVLVMKKKRRELASMIPN